MASAAEQLAANLSFSSFSKATDLKKRLWFTLFALIVYRFGTYIPLPGIDPDAYARAFDNQSQGLGGMINVFAGGAIERMAILALGIMPYISASIIMQLLTTMVPSLEALKKEGEQGRRMITQYTRYGTVILGTLQAYGIAIGLESGQGIVTDPGWFFRISTVISLVGGTMFLMWLGEQITARGVGNGISLIIFAGIAATMPAAVAQLLEQGRQGILSPIIVVAVLVMMVVLIGAIVFVERAQRRLLIQYPKRQMGMKMFQGDNSHLPLKLNTSGVIPPIFASTLLILPITLAGFGQTTTMPDWVNTIIASLGRGQPAYLFLYGALIMFFAFFYTAIVFNPKDTADNLKKQGGFIPGIRPGERTAEYIEYVLTRITTVGAIYLVIVCMIPEVFLSNIGISAFLGGTSLLILVSVPMDTIGQIQGHLFAHQYEGLLKKSQLRSGKKRQRRR